MNAEWIGKEISKTYDRISDFQNPNCVYNIQKQFVGEL